MGRVRLARPGAPVLVDVGTVIACQARAFASLAAILLLLVVPMIAGAVLAARMVGLGLLLSAAAVAEAVFAAYVIWHLRPALSAAAPPAEMRVPPPGYNPRPVMRAFADAMRSLTREEAGAQQMLWHGSTPPPPLLCP